MKTIFINSLIVASLAAVIGCETPYGEPDRTATGALAGGALGATTGAIIGHGSGRHGVEGALIGGAVGALAGGMIGHSMDQEHRAALARQSPETLQRMDAGQPLGLADIKALSRAGISDEVIISQIRNSRTAYRLTTVEIIDLKNAGVSQRVIDFMINTPSLYPPPPPPPPRRGYYY
jgi:outer membrane lipoprotein SlyB